jgi:ribosome-associated toxin RatA of RatAB toxin-antitoxin module
MMAERVKDTIDVKATTQEIFDVATEFEKYPEWNPNIKEVEVKATGADGLATEVWYKVDAKIKTLTYTLAYDYSGAPGSFSWDLKEGEVKKLSGSYSFDEFDDVTEVAYEIEIDPGFPVPGFLRKQAEKQIVRGALDDLKKRVESL